MEGFNGFGSLFQVANAASPSDFVTVAYLNSIKPGKMSTNMIDITHHQSANAHRERIAGLKDTAPFTIAGNYVPTNATQANGVKGLVGLWKSRETVTCRIILNDGSPNTIYGPFTGVVSGMEVMDVSVSDKVGFQAEITPDSQPTLP